MTSLLVIMTSLPVIMTSLPLAFCYYEVTSCHQESLPVNSILILVTVVSLPGLLESFTVENRLLPVIMRSLLVSKSHFLFTVEYFRLQ